jgi:hypothetical protein
MRDLLTLYVLRKSLRVAGLVTWMSPFGPGRDRKRRGEAALLAFFLAGKPCGIKAWSIRLSKT